MKELVFLNDLVSVFEKLPGVGKKTATRYAYYIIEKYDIDDINKVCETLINSFNSIHKCPICGMFTIAPGAQNQTIEQPPYGRHH